MLPSLDLNSRSFNFSLPRAGVAGVSHQAQFIALLTLKDTNSGVQRVCVIRDSLLRSEPSSVHLPLLLTGFPVALTSFKFIM